MPPLYADLDVTRAQDAVSGKPHSVRLSVGADLVEKCFQAASGDPLLALDLAARIVAGHFDTLPPRDWGSGHGGGKRPHG